MLYQLVACISFCLTNEKFYLYTNEHIDTLKIIVLMKKGNLV